MVLFVSDLDNTLIYSYKKDIGNRILVEEKDGKKLSYMTEEAYQMMSVLSDQVSFVPVTTRSMEQYNRIRFPEHLRTGKRTPEYALVSNGGILLHNGEIENEWLAESMAVKRESEEEMEKGMNILEYTKDRDLDVRLVDGLFVFTKVKNPERTLEQLNTALDPDQVSLFSNGEKVYIFPKKMSKAWAVRRLKERLRPHITAAAGDSMFDIGMLEEADVSFYPNELHGMIRERRGRIDCEIGRDSFLSNVVLQYLKDCFSVQAVPMTGENQEND